MNILLLLFYFIFLNIELFTMGFYIMKYRRINLFISLPFFVKFPIYITIGLSFKTIIYFIFGIFYVDKIIFLLIDIIIFFLLLFLIFKKKLLILENFKSDFIKSENITPLFLYILGMIYVIFVSNYIYWPSAGDAMYHGAYTSLILYNNRIPGSYSPFSFDKIQYPPGYGMLASSMSSLFNIYPGESVMILGAFIISIIPSLMYSLTYLKSESLIFSIASYLAAYVIVPGEAFKWLFGYFFNGTYPCLVGLSLIITIFIFSNYLKYSNMRIIVFFYISLILCSLILIFPSYVLFGICYPLYILYKEHEFIENFLLSNITYIAIIVIIFSIIGYYIYNSYIDNFYFIMRIFSGVTPKIQEYYIKPSFFYDNLNGRIVILSLSLLIILYFKNMKKIFEYNFFIVVSILTILSTNKFCYSYLSIILPRRSAILAVLTGWISLTLITCELTKIIEYSKIKKYIKYFSILIIFLLLIPSISKHLTFEICHEKSWFTRTKDNKLNYRVKDDFSTIKWMLNNIDSESLILNDMSYSSIYIPSFGMMNQTFTYLGNSSKYLELRNILNNPHDSVLVYNLLNKYNVKYILINGDWGYYDSVKWGGNDIYKRKEFDYVKIFNIHPFLNLTYQSGNTKLYSVKGLDSIYNLNISWSSTALKQGILTYPKITKSEEVHNMNEIIIDIDKGGDYGVSIIYNDYDPPINLEHAESISFNLKTNITSGIARLYVLAPDWDNYYSYGMNFTNSKVEKYHLFFQRLYIHGNPSIEHLGGVRFYFFSPGRYYLSSLSFEMINNDNLY